MTPRTITIDAAMQDANLLGAALGETASWSMWRTVLKAAFALQLDAAEMEIFTAIAGNRALPTKRVRELWVLAGRRSGKSRMAGLIAVYVAVFVKHKLAPGEIGAVLVLAAAQDQAKTIFNYAKAFLQS
jgi:phage terminase large subunit-like protein